MTFKPMLSIEQVRAILKPQFEYLAKSTGEVLWVHSFNVWAILSKFLFFIPRFEDKEKMLMEIAALIHDIGKTRANNQEILLGKKSGVVKHTATRDEITEYLKPFIEAGILQLKDNDFTAIWQFALHHHLSEEQLKEADIPSFGIYAEIVRYADWLASMRRIDLLKVNQIKNDLQGICDITLFIVGRFSSPSTYLMLDIASRKYQSLGWIPIVILDDGIVFIGPEGTSLPKKEEIIKEFIRNLQRKTYEGHRIKASYIRNEILAGKAREDPVSFLIFFENKIKDLLSDINNGPVIFFKILIELYKNSNQHSKLGKQSKIIDILIKSGSTGHITQARNLWIKWLRENKWIKSEDVEKEIKVNELMKEIFEKVKLSEVYKNGDFQDKELSKMTENELYNVLLTIAKKYFIASEDLRLKEAVSNLIVMEEETDFYRLSKECLERYKQYKEIRSPHNALCEHCGLPVPVIASPALNFPSHCGFTQINPIPDSNAPRVACPLCVFDVSTFYKERGGDKVYARINVKVPDAWQFYPNLKDFINRISRALENVYEIKSIKESEYLELPLPSYFEIILPNPKTKKEVSFEIPLQTERGLFFPLSSKGESIKNLRANYLALYSLLHLMGFEVHIGKVEQEGLFGSNIFEQTDITWHQLYYKGLVIVILAHLIKSSKKKKSNHFIYAQNILETSPSLTFSNLEDAKIKPELLGKVISFLSKIESSFFREVNYERIA